MAYPPVIAAALSGASLRQLSYWRSPRTREPLLAPAVRAGRQVAYSYQDVIALRTFVYLRSRLSLQRVRKAIRELRDMGQTEHLSAYRLIAMGTEVVWVGPDGDAVELTGSPGQHVIAEMIDILGGFVTSGRQVVPLNKPKPGVSVDPEVRGGYPVITGTRVPYDLVASLVVDGIAPAEISAFYPSVGADEASDAKDFAEYVDSYRRRAAA